jgi:hypothetical protein
MKIVFTIAAILISTSIFAGNENKNASDKEKASVITSVASLIGDEEVLTALGVNGQADITVKVDAEGIMHVEAVQTNNYLLEYHIRQSIDGAKMIVTESLVGKTVSFIMNVVQSK